MKRYWIFAGDVYYPTGGMEDFVESFDSIEEAQIFIKGFMCKRTGMWYQIYDTQEASMVELSPLQ